MTSIAIFVDANEERMLASHMGRNAATPGLAIRAMAAEDMAAGMRLCRASKWNQLEDDWRVFLNSTGGGGFLAAKEGRVVGTVTFLRYDGFAWIAMMLVDPQERGAGIGARLMEEALSSLKDVDCIGLDATPMGEPLYRRFGFVNDYALVRMQAMIETARVEPAPTPDVRRMRREDLSDVLRRDREVFGAGRGELLASLLERAPECAWIAKDGAAVRGYTFGRPGWLYHQFGPVVAEDSGTARSLVAQGLSELDGKRVALDVATHAPGLNGEWLAWLGSIGFVEERPFVRMFRHSLASHSHARLGIPARQYAIAGPEFG